MPVHSRLRTCRSIGTMTRRVSCVQARCSPPRIRGRARPLHLDDHRYLSSMSSSLASATCFAEQSRPSKPRFLVDAYADVETLRSGAVHRHSSRSISLPSSQASAVALFAAPGGGTGGITASVDSVGVVTDFTSVRIPFPDSAYD